MESRKVHTLETGGSNPPPAIYLLKVTLSVLQAVYGLGGLPSHGEKVIAYPDGCCAVRKA